MLRRLSALIFVLAIAGQASAAVCNCMGYNTEKTHPCCKPIDSKVPVVSQKGCCDPLCNAFASQSVDRSRTETSVRFMSGVASGISNVPGPEQPALMAVHAANAGSFVDQRIKYARPPNLYILHQVFLV